MNIQTLRQLSAIAPPRAKRLRYRTSAGATDRIAELESELGLPASKSKWNLIEANALVDELERLKALKATSAPPAPAEQAPPDAPVAPPQRIAAGLTGRSKFCAAFAVASASPKAKTHPEYHGRDRFIAGARINSTPQILAANQSPASVGAPAKTKKTGRERFISAVVIQQ